MRNIIFYTIVATLFTGFYSCCHKKYCEGFDGQSQVYLINFAVSDADSVAIEIFKQGTSIRLDSSFSTTFAYVVNGSPEFVFNLPETIKKNHDYKITILSTGQTFVLSNFVTNKESCNNCFPHDPPSDQYNVLNNYDVNGQIQYSFELRIVN